MQRFKEQATETLESAGNAKNKKGETQNIVLNSLGEIRLVMSSDAAYAKWVQVFSKYQTLELHDPDTKQPLKDLRDDRGNKIKYPHFEISSAFLRPLVGLDDSHLELLADHILADDPKVYLGICRPQFPKNWTRAQRMQSWIQRKKFKVVIIKIVMGLVMKNKNSKVTRAIPADAYVPQYWSLAKKYLSVSTFHLDYAMRVVGKDWLRNQITQGKNKVPLPPAGESVVRMMLNNRERHKICLRAADHSFRMWKTDQRTFSNNHFCWRGGKVHLYDNGRAIVQVCEVGILDFRMLPTLGEEVSTHQAFDIYLDSLDNLLGSHFDEVATWMLIYARSTEDSVQRSVSKFFPNHTVHATLEYRAGKGKPPQNPKEEIRIMYIQTPEREVLTCVQMVEEVDITETPRLSEPDSEVEPLDDTADSIDTYRSDHRHFVARCELRTEVYMNFLDKYCRPSGSVLLYFCGLKALTACAVRASLASPPHFSGRSPRNIRPSQ